MLRSSNRFGEMCRRRTHRGGRPFRMRPYPVTERDEVGASLSKRRDFVQVCGVRNARRLEKLRPPLHALFDRRKWRVPAAALAGRPGELEIQLGKARTAGTSAGSILFNAQRQLAQLHKWRLAIEQGKAFSLEAVSPPLPFRRRPLVEAALKAWSAARLGIAMADLADAVLQSRRNPALVDSIAERALLAIASSGWRSAA